MRDNYNNKISVLNKIIGLDEELHTDDLYKVPQNSTTNMSVKLGLSEPQILENSQKNKKFLPTCKCPHCENMAKNFLYLESLIRSNCKAQNNCNVCQSSLQYLQYVNRNILKVFGNFDSVVQAAQAFGHNVKAKVKMGKLQNCHQTKRLKSTKQLTNKTMPVKEVKSPGKIKYFGMKMNKRMKGGQSVHKTTMEDSQKLKKTKFKKDFSNHSVDKSELLNGATKILKKKKFKVLKNKTQKFLHKIKVKN